MVIAAVKPPHGPQEGRILGRFVSMAFTMEIVDLSAFSGLMVHGLFSFCQFFMLFHAGKKKKRTL